MCSVFSTLCTFCTFCTLCTAWMYIFCCDQLYGLTFTRALFDLHQCILLHCWCCIPTEARPESASFGCCCYQAHACLLAKQLCPVHQLLVSNTIKKSSLYILYCIHCPQCVLQHNEKSYDRCRSLNSSEYDEL